MDDRGYIAQALFDRLRAGEFEFRVLGDTRGYPDTAGDEVDVAVHPNALGSMPRAVARFCHEFDLQLVQRSEEHTSELQSHSDLVCRLLLEKKKNNNTHYRASGIGLNYIRSAPQDS